MIIWGALVHIVDVYKSISGDQSDHQYLMDKHILPQKLADSNLSPGTVLTHDLVDSHSKYTVIWNGTVDEYLIWKVMND